MSILVIPILFNTINNSPNYYPTINYYPRIGWYNQLIEYIIQQCSIMDSNNSISNVGLGEREARCYNSLISTRHYNLLHGIGRSGDLYAQQPKAMGLSMLVKLCHIITKHALKICGIQHIDSCIVLPTATGMSITLSLLS